MAVSKGVHQVADSPVFQENGYGVYIASPFGNRVHPVYKTNSQHKGVDVLLAKTSTSGGSAATITSIGDGTVKTAFKNCRGFDDKTNTAGNYVVIDHGNGLVTKYMHMQYGSIPVSAGDKVSKGQKIGYMGTTGCSTGVHLHFQVESNGTAIEPYPYLMGTKTIGDPVSTSSIFAQPVNIEETGAGYQPSVNDILAKNNYNISDSEFVKIKNIAGVFGLPYQFLPTADLRLDGSKSTENIGYEYGERIIERIPLLFIAPGKASFMTKYSKKNKQSVLEKFKCHTHLYMSYFWSNNFTIFSKFSLLSILERGHSIK